MGSADRGSRRPRPVLAGIAADRAGLIELVLTAIVLALAVELTAGGLLDAVGAKTMGYVGLGLGLAVLGYTIFRFRRRSPHTYEAFLVADQQGGLVPIARYPFATTLQWLLPFCFALNPALRQAWVDSREDVIREATEYLVFNILADQLESFASKSELRNERMQELSAADMDSIGVSNGVLTTLARPEEWPIDKGDFDGKIVSLVGEGLIISEFRLKLPKDTTLWRDGAGSVRLDTKRFRLRLNVERSEGWSGVPQRFYARYLHADPTGLETISLDVKVDVHVRARALVAVLLERYYGWIDLFRERLDDQLGAPAFFERIDWDSAITVADVLGSERSASGEDRYLSADVDSSGESFLRVAELLAEEGLPIKVREDNLEFRIPHGSSVVIGRPLIVDDDPALGIVVPLLTELPEDREREVQILRVLNDLNAKTPLVRFSHEPEQRAVVMRREISIGGVQIAAVLHQMKQALVQADLCHDRLLAALECGRLAREGAERSPVD